MTFDVQKVDAIYHPEFDLIKGFYNLPVMFKSIPYGESYERQGYIDNGRNKFSLKRKEDSTSKV